ncbi:MAG: hypothetical protein LJF04_05460 [Gemmatimonadetes bacterium]|nr:hypothetical protein [Gemmatimonadota bacterium]
MGLVWMALVCAGCGDVREGHVLQLPRRPLIAPGGAEVAAEIRSLDLEAREDRIYAEVARGNVPDWLRRLRPVVVTGRVEGHEHSVTFWVAPDYLAVGSDSDSFVIPLSARTGQRIADLVGGSLPTPRMVDAVWSSAEARLAPIRLEPGDSMATVRYFERHDRLVEAQRALYGVSPEAFVAGDKLDVVVTPTVFTNPGKVALYGWHRPDGRPIRALFTEHRDDRVVFSHGLRLVDRRVTVDGRRRDLWEVLRDPSVAPLLSRRGVVSEPRYAIGSQGR